MLMFRGVKLLKLCIFSVEMREVKEIRLGKYSKDFDKWPEESKNFDPMQCFVLFHGSEFKLKVFSVAGNEFALDFLICN